MLIPWPGPHEMALRRTSVQLPTIETQSSPEGKGNLGGGLNEIETMHMADKSQLQSSMLFSPLHPFQNVLKNHCILKVKEVLTGKART